MRPVPKTRRDDGLPELALEAASLEGLNDATLLTLMLARGASCADPQTTTADLFARFETLGAILSADLPELARTHGLGPVALTDLKLLRLLCERLARCRASRRPAVSSWSALVDYVRVALADAPREQFRALFLDRKNHLLRDEMIGQGTVDHAPVYVARVVECYLALTAGRGVRSARQCAVSERGS